MAPRSRTTMSRGSGSSLRGAIDEFVKALPLGRLAQRLASMEGAVSRLEREVRRLRGSTTSSGAKRSTAKRSTAKRSTKSSSSTRTRTPRKTAAAKSTSSPTTSRKRTTTKSSAPRKTTATRKTTAARRPAPTAPPTPSLDMAPPVLPAAPLSPFDQPPGLSGEADLISEALSTSSSPVGPAPLPEP